MKERKISVRHMAMAGLTAAAYFVATAMIAPFGFGEIQFRVSEIFNLMAFIHPVYAIGVTLGCLISNIMLSPLGLPDILFGTLHTALATFAITKTKNLFAASLWPTVFAVIIGFEVAWLSNLPFFMTTATIMLSEFIVVTGIGFPLFAFLMNKNKGFVKLLKG